MAAAEPRNAALLAEAAMLDGWLDRYEAHLPGADRIHAAAAGAPDPGARLLDAVPWWPGLGLAGVGAAGVLVGALLIRQPAAAGDPDSYAWSYDQILDSGDGGAR